ncbi:MAG: hypothetical protein ABI847_09225 [Anaerolineales bacterium]
MSREAGQAWFRIAVLITVVSAVLVFFTEPGSAERVVSILTVLMGLLFIGLIAIFVRRARL